MGEKSGDFLAGFVLGGLVGAAVALLLAPQPGEETRSLLRERSIELKERADELSAEARKRAEELAAEARKRSAELQEKGKVAVDSQASRLKEAVQEGKATAEKTKQELLRQIKAGGEQAVEV